jgi:hypothetical protein
MGAGAALPGLDGQTSRSASFELNPTARVVQVAGERPHAVTIAGA